ncbi:MAG: M23 family metallopeptidase [Bryobacteraceae bacterium]|nr:M23 family metallopeptidase [Bryobacteraceae bacterium]
MMKRIVLPLAAIVVAGMILLFVLSSTTALRVDPPVRVVGTETPVRLQASNPHGIRRVTAWIEQDGQQHQVFEKAEPATRFFFFGRNEPAREITFSVGTKDAPSVKDGKARLIIETTANDFRGATDRVVSDVEINTRPPVLTADGHQHYINQGGSELVTFTVSGYWTEAGVRVGKHTFRSFPVPGKDESSGERFSLFAFPWDTPADIVPVVYARNPSGAETTARFWFKLFPKKFRSRELPLNDAFLQKVVNELDPGGSGDLLSRYLKINGEMRRQNNETLAGLRHKTEQKVLWSGPFVQLSNSKVESLFADTRSYMYNGRKVDEQTHLGFDLSVVKNVPVAASNDGRVIYAAPLGIYGNCVVIDHGYGLQSIYGHLNSIGVKPGEFVKKRQEIGRSGETGLAGGDHLHFSMQVDGVQVNPIEWWDDHWIQDRILSKLTPIGGEVSHAHGTYTPKGSPTATARPLGRAR